MTGVAPGRCGEPCPSLAVFCDLRAGHAGQHEGRQYPPEIVSAGMPVYWSAAVEILTPDADGLVHVEDGWRIRRTYTVGQPGEIIERLG